MKMRTKLIIVATIAAAVAVLFQVVPAQAQVAPVASSAPRIVFYDSGNVASGAVINSTVLSTLTTLQCEVWADNSAGGSTRTLTVTWYASDKTTVMETQTVSLTTGLRGMVNVSAQASAATQPSATLTVPHSPGWYMAASLSAAGSANGRVVIICR